MQAQAMTLGSVLSSRRLCEANGWGVGTVIVADALPKETSRLPRVYQITGFGQRAILAVRWDWAHGQWDAGHEQDEFSLHLPTRQWREETETERDDRQAGRRPGRDVRSAECGVMSDE